MGLSTEEKIQVEAAFKGILTTEISEHITTLGPDFLDDNEKATLKVFQKHFLGDQDDVSQILRNQNIRLEHPLDGGVSQAFWVDLEQHEQQPPKKKGRGRPCKADRVSDLSMMSGNTAVSNDSSQTLARANQSWWSIRNLQTLELDETLRRHVRSNTEKDASQFLGVTGTFSQATTSPPLVYQTPIAALFDCYLTADKMRDRNLFGSVSYLFHLLLIGDIATTIYGTKLSISDRRFQDLREFIGIRYQSMEQVEKVKMGLEGAEEPVETLCTKLRVIVNRGSRLLHLVQQFGTGSLFFLYEKLNDTFIDSRWTSWGSPYEEAMSKLRSLQLAEKAEESGTNELGNAIRAYLRRLYNVDSFGVAAAEPEGVPEVGSSSSHE